MPLEQGSDRATISRNIHEMEAAGHPHDQSVAAALHTAHPHGGKKKKKTRRRARPHRGTLGDIYGR